MPAHWRRATRSAAFQLVTIKRCTSAEHRTVCYSCYLKLLHFTNSSGHLQFSVSRTNVLVDYFCSRNMRSCGMLVFCHGLWAYLPCRIQQPVGTNLHHCFVQPRGALFQPGRNHSFVNRLISRTLIWKDVNMLRCVLSFSVVPSLPVLCFFAFMCLFLFQMWLF